MRFDILTLFPDLFSSFLRESVLGRAIKRGVVDIRLTDIRSCARGPHRVTDDRPYGGGNGMVMKVGPISRALNSIERDQGTSRVILLTPQGEPFVQATAWEMSRLDHLILVCGRYEGVDERIRLDYIDRELSIGDYVVSGGELGAMVVLDAVCRLVPGVLGGERSNLEDSFEEDLLEYPQYTRPRVFNDREVPPVLLSGDHEKIRLWRREESLKRTLERRPDLLKKARLKEEDRVILAGLQGGR
jgi:tRNA (guanine37-N1)-methyltransferase